MDEWREFPKNKPDAVGWYATLHSWEAGEGFYPGGHYWDGGVWNGSVPIIFFSPMSFLNESDAYEWAHAHDVED